MAWGLGLTSSGDHLLHTTLKSASKDSGADQSSERTMLVRHSRMGSDFSGKRARLGCSFVTSLPNLTLRIRPLAKVRCDVSLRMFLLR